ncbi:MAG: RNA-binding S4 domain-containing protein [Rikenellaceae bacterium]|nr:RNA-binding S4 domain-containing protein [Rikenellaceae bacterium]
MSRIDKWLWAVRVFKTRSDAAAACKNNRITVNGSVAKASKEVKKGDIVTVKKMPVIYTLRVLEELNNRQPAKNVPNFMENITPPEELGKLYGLKNDFFVMRDRGAGRPTKKERRDIDDMMDSFLYDGEEEGED